MATLTKHSITEDFSAWALETADLLEQRRFDELDITDLVEEVRGLANSQYLALQSQLRTLFTHLLKWACQPEKRSNSWQVSILNARDEIEALYEQSPSLRSRLPKKRAQRLWQSARKRAAFETGLPITTFPETCPWDLDTNVFNPDWLP